MNRLNHRCREVLLVSAAAVLAFAVHAQPAPANELRVAAPETAPSGTGREATITQFGGGNSAVVSQKSVPSGADAEQALDLKDELDEFELYEGSDLSADSESGLVEGAKSETQDLSGLLETFKGRVDKFGGNNTATVIQSAPGNNRALAVQAGSGNRLVTEQYGSNNIGVHLQRGSGNNTILQQSGSGNVNALVAQGGVTNGDGGPVTLDVQGGVKGFSLRAQGPQNYSTVSVRPNGPGSQYKIDVQ